MQICHKDVFFKKSILHRFMQIDSIQQVIKGKKHSTSSAIIILESQHSTFPKCKKIIQKAREAKSSKFFQLQKKFGSLGQITEKVRFKRYQGCKVKHRLPLLITSQVITLNGYTTVKARVSNQFLLHKILQLGN